VSKVTPSHDEGQLIVAGVRVQAHRDGRPPLLEDVATLLAMPPELLRVLVAALEEHGVLRQLTSAFEVRLDIVDAAAVDSLPKTASAARLNSEVDEFRRAFQSRQDDLKNSFGGEALQKKTDDRMSRLAEELKKFKGRGGPGPSFSSLDDPKKRYDDDDD
jgi:hypothetical protein